MLPNVLTYLYSGIFFFFYWRSTTFSSEYDINVVLASILTCRLRLGGCLCVLTFIFYTVKAAYYSQLGKLQEHSLH